MTAAWLAWSLAGLFAAAACSEVAEESYTFEITGPADAFVGATVATLSLADREIARTAVNGNMPFSLEVGGLDPVNTPFGIFAVRGLDAAGNLVAFGQTPEIEIETRPNLVRIFVQKPGTLVKSPVDLGVQLREPVVMRFEAVPGPGYLRGVTTPVFGLGATTAGAASSQLFAYNPITHRTVPLEYAGKARYRSTGLGRPDGISFLFGGLSAVPPPEGPEMMPPPPLPPLVETIEQLQLERGNFSQFSLRANTVPIPGFARAGVAMTSLGNWQYVFGGIDATGPVAKTTRFARDNAQPVELPPMMAARTGHTVTADPTAISTAAINEARILIYGGATPGQPVAELLDTDPNPVWAAIAQPAPAGAVGLAHPGTNRKDHQAIILPVRTTMGNNAQFLILGGRADDGSVRGDSILCIPAEARFEVSPITLRTPRADFAAFTLRDDLVIVGGVNSAGQPVATAEIYNAKTLAFIAEVPATPRARPGVTTLGGTSAIILGGDAAGTPVTAIEIYQPLRSQ